MSKKQKFIELVNVLMENVSVDETEWADALLYFETFKNIEEKEKPEITEKGKEILRFIQDNYELKDTFSAKNVAEGMMVQTKSVSASMRGLVSGGFLEKMTDKPVVYTVTEKGKNFNIED